MLPLKKITPAAATASATPVAKGKDPVVTPPRASAQSPAPVSTELLPSTQKSHGTARFPPTSTLTPKQGLLISAQNLEANLGWESLPMQTLSSNTFGSDKKFAMD